MRIHCSEGNALISQGKFTEAKKSYEDGLALEPTDSDCQRGVEVRPGDIKTAIIYSRQQFDCYFDIKGYRYTHNNFEMKICF